MFVFLGANSLTSVEVMTVEVLFSSSLLNTISYNMMVLETVSITINVVTYNSSEGDDNNSINI